MESYFDDYAPEEHIIKYKNDCVLLKAPVVFCIYPNEVGDIECDAHVKSTMECLSRLTDLIYKESLNVHLDFSVLQYMGEAASVILFAEITRAQLITKNKNIVLLTLPVNTALRSRFNKTDLNKAISPGGFRKISSLFDDNNHYQSGTDPNKFNASTLLGVISQGVDFSKPESKLFSRGVSEAMLNVIHHAYPEGEVHNEYDMYSEVGNRWWQYSYYDVAKKKLVFIIYDKGIGIPCSIGCIAPQDMNDGEKIEFVMRKGITRFIEDSKRGTGYGDILKLAEISDKSRLLVYSDEGIYYLDRAKNISKCGINKFRVNGTLIEWQIPYE